jgi:hypothetical protein
VDMKLTAAVTAVTAACAKKIKKWSGVYYWCHRENCIVVHILAVTKHQADGGIWKSILREIIVQKVSRQPTYMIADRFSKVRNRLGITEKASDQLGILIIITIIFRITLEPIHLQEKKKLLKAVLWRRLVKLMNLCA